MDEPKSSSRFEHTMLPHLPAAYNVARWLTRRPDDAHDIVQDAYVRAFRHFGSYRGENAKAWLLTIVRHTAYNWLRQHRAHEFSPLPDPDVIEIPETAQNPEQRVEQQATQERLRQALEDIPLEFREVILLRDLEGFSYKEIAEITGLPMGTIMSRLSRARDRLQAALTRRHGKGVEREL